MSSDMAAPMPRLLKGFWEDDERATLRSHRGHRKIYRRAADRLDGRRRRRDGVTPDLLKEAGYTYLLDWPFDDQPIWMRTRSGPSVACPIRWNSTTPARWSRVIIPGANSPTWWSINSRRCWRQREEQPLVFALSLHGFVVGQPFRLRPLRQAIKHCVEHKHADRVWFTRAVDIANYCFGLKPGIIPGS